MAHRPYGATQPRSREIRRRVAIEAARLMVEGGLRDFGHAKLKAAGRLGVHEESNLPANGEIEEALREHHRLFLGGQQPRTLQRLRETAREAMRFLSRHEPRLVGAVLEGTADEHSPVCLHLYSDQPDEVVIDLRERGIPFEQRSRRLRLDRTTVREFPVLQFGAGRTPIDITVLPYVLLRQAPFDRVSERPMRRASLAALEALIGTGA